MTIGLVRSVDVEKSKMFIVSCGKDIGYYMSAILATQRPRHLIYDAAVFVLE
jgi:hypothetical protein